MDQIKRRSKYQSKVLKRTLNRAKISTTPDTKLEDILEATVEYSFNTTSVNSELCNFNETAELSMHLPHHDGQLVQNEDSTEEFTDYY